MNVLIIGCGKVGSHLADTLCQLGHDVSIIALNRENFDLLSDDFSGLTIQGVPIDLDILRQAGIEECDALAAVTEDDNTNIMVCQIAREIFNVPKIVARIFDPLREVARYCGMGEGQAKSQLFRIRKRLKAYLEQEGFVV